MEMRRMWKLSCGLYDHNYLNIDKRTFDAIDIIIIDLYSSLIYSLFNYIIFNRLNFVSIE